MPDIELTLPNEAQPAEYTDEDSGLTFTYTVRPADVADLVLAAKQTGITIEEVTQSNGTNPSAGAAVLFCVAVAKASVESLVRITKGENPVTKVNGKPVGEACELMLKRFPGFAADAARRAQELAARVGEERGNSESASASQ